MPSESEIQQEQAKGSALSKDNLGREKTNRTSVPMGAVVTKQQEKNPYFDNTVYNPTAIHMTLKNAEYGNFGPQLDMFQRMKEGDAHLGSVVQSRRLKASKAQSAITPPEGFEEDAMANKAVEYLQAVLVGIAGYKGLVGLLIDGPVDGFKGLEIEWRGQVPVALHETPNIGWRWYGGGLQYQNENGEWLDVPQDKFIIHSPRGNSPQLVRRGVMRTVCYAWVLKHYATRDWASFVEVYGMPTRFAKVPKDWEDSDPRLVSLWSALKAMSSDGFGVFNEDIELEAFAKGVGATGSPHKDFSLWCDQQFSKAVLGQTLTTDTTGQTGTYAAAKVHREVELDIVEADVEEIAETIRRDLFAPIIGYGLGWDVVVPVLHLEIENTDDEEKDASKLDTAVNKLGLDVPAAEGYRMLRIRPPEEGEELLPGEQQNTTLPEGFATARRQSCDHALAIAGDGADETQLALAALAAMSAEQWADLNGQFVMNDVATMVRENPDLSVADAIPRLTALYPTLPVEELQDAIHETMVAAAANGLIEIDAEADNPLEDRQDGIEREERGEGPGRDDKPTKVPEPEGGDE